MTLTEFTSRVLPFKDKLYRFAWSLLRHSEEAEDAVQEVYLKLWHLKQELERIVNLEAYAMQMTKNQCFNILKSKRLQAVEMPSTLTDAAPAPDRRSEISEAASGLARIIAELPDMQRMIITLRDVEAYEFDEIAAITGLTVNHVRVQLSRARKTVRDRYIKDYGHATR